MGPLVDEVLASAYVVPTDGPEADGTLTWSATTLVLVEARSGDVTGWGYTYAPAAAAKVVREQLASTVAGCSATAPATAWTAMQRSVRNAGRQGLVGMAMSAVDIALWDLAARLHQLPLVELWGHAPVEVPVYGSGGFTSYDEQRLRAQLEGWIELGLSAVKIKIGEDRGDNPGRDVRRTAIAREVVGDADLFVDANGAYSVGQARRVARALDDLGVTWLEEPVTSDDLDGMRRLRDELTIDVAAGEYGWDLDYFDRMAGAVDCLQVDVTRCGGYTEWLRVAALARARHLDVSGHCAPYVTAPVAAATPGFRHQEWFHDHVRIEQRFFTGTEDPVGGALPPSCAWGHGLEPRRAEMAGHRVA
jgi:L-alanine-DL-glutamate epimerase-like enolase superfamily enzyme